MYADKLNYFVLLSNPPPLLKKERTNNNKMHVIVCVLNLNSSCKAP